MRGVSTEATPALRAGASVSYFMRKEDCFVATNAPRNDTGVYSAPNAGSSNVSVPDLTT